MRGNVTIKNYFKTGQPKKLYVVIMLKVLQYFNLSVKVKETFFAKIHDPIAPNQLLLVIPAQQ